MAPAHIDTIKLDPWLVQIFARNGYIRHPDMERRKLEKTHYKMGWETRLVLKSEAELKRAQRLATRAGLKPGKPFQKARQWVLPLYGKPVADAFLRARGS